MEPIENTEMAQLSQEAKNVLRSMASLKYLLLLDANGAYYGRTADFSVSTEAAKEIAALRNTFVFFYTTDGFAPSIALGLEKGVDGVFYHDKERRYYYGPETDYGFLVDYGFSLGFKSFILPSKKTAPVFYWGNMSLIQPNAVDHVE